MEDVTEVTVSPDAFSHSWVTTFDVKRTSNLILVPTDKERNLILKSTEIHKDVVYKRIKWLKG